MYSLVVLCIGLIIGLMAYFIRPGKLLLSALSMCAVGYGAGWYFAENPSLGSMLLVYFTLFQILNIARLIEDRLHEKYLKNAFLKGGLKLVVLQAVSVGLDIAMSHFEYISASKVIIIAGLVGSAVILVAVLARILMSQPKGVKNYLSDKELPSISVLVPARNEDSDLEELLATLVANDYPKLEILVLDDCSTGKNIPEIVKKYAHGGVRFVQGDTPSENWLAKNQAYKSLYEQSSGDWLIFMGVDVRLGVSSLRAMVHYALEHNKHMISILPRRFNAHFWAGFASPLRYFRELVKINYNKRNTPALSTVWLISREAYESTGGMDSVARKVIPEQYFAGELNKKKQYAFVRTNDYLQISTAKKLNEQIRTSLRVIYPSLHRRMERVALSVLFLFIFMVLPYVFSVYYFIVGQGGWQMLAVLITCGLLTVTHALITSLTNPIIWPLSLVNLPYAAAQEIVLSFVSMVRYEFGEVDWKGRNVCLPVMHVIPRLPKID